MAAIGLTRSTSSFSKGYALFYQSPFESLTLTKYDAHFFFL